MKRPGKAAALLALILLLTALLTACGNKKSGDTDNGKGGVEMTEMVKQALTLTGADMENFNAETAKVSEKMLMESAAYLEKTLSEKYPGVEFEMTACVPNSIVQHHDEFTLQPAGRPGDEFTANVTGGESFSCTDSYYGILKIADYEALVSEKLAAVEPGAQVFCTIDFQFAESCGADTPIADAVADTGMFAYTWILLQPGAADFSDRAAAIEQVFAGSELRGDYAVYLMTEGSSALSKAEAFEKIPANSDTQVYSDVARFIRQ